MMTRRQFTKTIGATAALAAAHPGSIWSVNASPAFSPIPELAPAPVSPAAAELYRRALVSQWNGYTDSAKASCKDRGVGLFKFGEFLGAVYYDGDKFLDYSPPSAEEREEPNRRRRR